MTAPGGSAKSPGVSAVAGKALGYLRNNTLLALWLLLAVFILAIEIIRPGTVTPVWITNTVLFAAPLGIMAAGQTLVMLTGGIDLSVAIVASGAAYLLATNASLGTPIALVIGVSLGLFVGLANGIGVALLRVQPLVMTLGTGLMAAGVMIVYSQRMLASQPRVPDLIRTLGSAKIGGVMPYDLLLWAPIAVLMIVALRRWGFGRLVYAIGDNREACELGGIRVWRVQLAVYVLCSVFAALAGFLLVGGTNASNLQLADSYLLPSVAAVIIGGTTIFGGRGGYSGTIVGALILTVLTSLLTLLDTREPVKQILYGTIILALAAAYAQLTD